MANVINLKTEYEEFEIGDKTYRLYLSDEKIKQFSKDFERLGVSAEELDKKSEESVDESKDLAIDMFDLLFEEGAGLNIYKTCGRSTYVMMDVFRQIIPHVQNKIDDLKELEVKKYTE